MTDAVTNPPALHDPTAYGYSHLARVPAGAELVLVAGQYASGPDGSVAATDFATQVELSFANVGIALEAAGAGFDDVVQLRTFICDHGPDKLPVLVEHIRRIWGDTPPTQTLLGVAALALPGMLFEVDAVAVRRPSA